MRFYPGDIVQIRSDSDIPVLGEVLEHTDRKVVVRNVSFYGDTEVFIFSDEDVYHVGITRDELGDDWNEENEKEFENF